MLLAFTPLGAHATGAVLCIEEDGEVVVEIAEGESCVGDEHQHTSSEEPHCGACMDIPIPSRGDVDCASFKVENAPSVHVVLQVVGQFPNAHATRTKSSVRLLSMVKGDEVSSSPALDSCVVLLI